MRSTAEHTTVLIPEFPRILHRRVRARAILEGKPIRRVFRELIERALARADEMGGGDAKRKSR